MIFGVNFNNTQIPTGIKRKFAARVRVAPRLYAQLQGVAQSRGELQAALLQGCNGTRRWHIVTRKTSAGDWYGLYVDPRPQPKNPVQVSENTYACPQCGTVEDFQVDEEKGADTVTRCRTCAWTAVSTPDAWRAMFALSEVKPT